PAASSVAAPRPSPSSSGRYWRMTSLAIRGLLVLCVPQVPHVARPALVPLRDHGILAVGTARSTRSRRPGRCSILEPHPLRPPPRPPPAPPAPPAPPPARHRSWGCPPPATAGGAGPPRRPPPTTGPAGACCAAWKRPGPPPGPSSPPWGAPPRPRLVSTTPTA